MKPSSLRPGDKLRRKTSGHNGPLIWVFVRREKRRPGRPAMVFMKLDIDDGGAACADQGLAYASDFEIARYFVQVAA
jgi:hypothetical protein